MRKYLLFTIFFCLVFNFSVQASPLKKVWEKTLNETFPRVVDVDPSGLIGCITQNATTILDKDGNTVFKQANLSRDWIIQVNSRHFLLQNGGNGAPSTIKLYDYKGNKLWEIKEKVLGMAKFSPKGNYIVCSDASWNDFKVFSIEGKTILRMSTGSPFIQFDEEETFLSASHLGIFSLKDGQLKSTFDDKSVDYTRMETYFVERGEKIVIQETNPEFVLKLYDNNLHLIWSMNSVGGVYVFDDLIFVSTGGLEIFNLNREKVGSFSLKNETITTILWASKDMEYIAVNTFSKDKKDYFKIINFKGEILYQKEESIPGDQYLFNSDLLLAYIVRNNGKSFTIECFQLVK